MRIDRFLSNLPRFNRQQVRLLLVQRRIRIDGQPVSDPKAEVREFSRVELDEEVLQVGKPARYFMLHKPEGYVCSNEDPDHPTVFFLMDEPAMGKLHVVGRLDLDTTGLVLVTALTGDTATLQSGEQRWRMPLATLAGSWRGDFATLWRTPPGQTTRLVDGRTGPAADWLGERIAGLQAAGKVPPSGRDLTARIQAFQRVSGIEAAGLAGPITFMQVNLASGVDEPRLSSPGS